MAGCLGDGVGLLVYKLRGISWPPVVSVGRSVGRPVKLASV